MSKKAQQQRRQAATHYHDAARNHQESAHLTEAGNYEREHHPDFAAEQQRHAAHGTHEASKQTPSADGKKK